MGNQQKLMQQFKHHGNPEGGGGKMTAIFDHLAYVRVSWSDGKKILTMTTVKISKLPWSNGQNWPFLTMTMGKIDGAMVMANFLTMDHGVSRVSWSWSMPSPPPIIHDAIPVPRSTDLQPNNTDPPKCQTSFKH